MHPTYGSGKPRDCPISEGFIQNTSAAPASRSDAAGTASRQRGQWIREAAHGRAYQVVVPADVRHLVPDHRVELGRDAERRPPRTGRLRRLREVRLDHVLLRNQSRAVT